MPCDRKHVGALQARERMAALVLETRNTPSGFTMIFISATLIAGRSAEQKANMFREMTDATALALKVPVDAVRIAIDEVPASHFAVAGIAKSGPSSDGPATSAT